MTLFLRDHKELTTISNEQVIGELKWTEEAIKEVIGVTPRLMRPVSLLLCVVQSVH